MDFEQFYQQILRLTGRTGRLKFGKPATPPQRKLVQSYLDELCNQSNFSDIDIDEIHVKYQLFNAILRSLGIKTVSKDFFTRVMNKVNFNSIESFSEAVNTFRQIVMLKYGNFRYGFKILRQSEGNRIDDLWSDYFPDKDSMRDRRKSFQSRLPMKGLKTIKPERLFTLGYLAIEHLEGVNAARTRMKDIVSNVIPLLGDDDKSNLNKILKKQGLTAEWRQLLARINLPAAQDIGASPAPLYRESRKSNEPESASLRELKSKLTIYNKEDIEKTKEEGRFNTDVYLSNSEIDIYIATSMRDLPHFTSMARFVDSLFSESDLKSLKLFYFDPTQSYIDDRIQKGLIECLMVKRAKLTIYNAQESDTFGKDSEAAISLALGKPVIVYVARFFNDLLKPKYKIVDNLRECDAATMMRKLVDDGLLENNYEEKMLRAELRKGEIIKDWVETNILPVLQNLEIDDLLHECLHHGYSPDHNKQAGCFSDPSSCLKYVCERIIKHESRALTFHESHPLALQTAVDTGVANGVMVTRTIKQTAELAKRILVGGMEYLLDENDENNTLLREVLTHSPVRIVTSNEILTTAFWDSYFRKNEMKERLKQI